MGETVRNIVHCVEMSKIEGKGVRVSELQGKRGES